MGMGVQLEEAGVMHRQEAGLDAVVSSARLVAKLAHLYQRQHSSTSAQAL